MVVTSEKKKGEKVKERYKRDFFVPVSVSVPFCFLVKDMKQIC